MKSVRLLAAAIMTVLAFAVGSVASPQAEQAERSPVVPPRAEVDSPAPAFVLDGVVDGEFKKIALGDYRGSWVVLFFYPGDFTLVCPTEIKGFNAALGEFAKASARVLAVSTDSRFSHRAWIESGVFGKLGYPLLADFTKQVSRRYGVLNEESGASRRGIFIIDPAGVIRYLAVHNDKVGRSVEETLRVLAALQTDELCPLNWKPGAKTLSSGSR